MIVQRITWHVKVGREDDLVELLKPYLHDETTPLKRVCRNSPGSIGPLDCVVGEFEFENLGAVEEGWRQWFESDDAATFMPKWNELVERGGYSETWELVE